jgi:hypothetical protein
MKLDKFKVPDCGACPVCHGNTIAGCNVWICCIEIDLAAPTRTEDGSLCPPVAYVAAFTLENIGTEAEIIKLAAGRLHAGL